MQPSRSMYAAKLFCKARNSSVTDLAQEHSTLMKTITRVSRLIKGGNSKPSKKKSSHRQNLTYPSQPAPSPIIWSIRATTRTTCTAHHLGISQPVTGSTCSATRQTVRLTKSNRTMAAFSPPETMTLSPSLNTSIRQDDIP